ncbi:unnamed protein product [Hydatigera taeniaeformis]|uniref:Post-GPI attachment to proteins factor 2 n=1 Tax=Hydatigena taeniaeformis TaxID=6205 RepID=A0A0R3X4U2_HYDTA|nr:unnamed protein product [Hydatigera taeniaeformis]
MAGRLGSLNFRDIAVTTVYLPFCCMIGCLSYAMFFYFDEVTESKCGVHNFVPSISGAVCMRPLLHLWRFCIVAHAVPHKVVSWRSYTSLVSLIYLLGLSDILSLCGLTIVSTVDNFSKAIFVYVSSDVHEFFFIIFGLSSFLYMTSEFYLHFRLNCQRLLPRTVSFLLEYWFSIAEFGIAFANMGFHGTAAKDFYNLKIIASLT